MPRKRRGGRQKALVAGEKAVPPPAAAPRPHTTTSLLSKATHGHFGEGRHRKSVVGKLAHKHRASTEGGSSPGKEKVNVVAKLTHGHFGAGKHRAKAARRLAEAAHSLDAAAAVDVVEEGRLADRAAANATAAPYTVTPRTAAMRRATSLVEDAETRLRFAERASTGAQSKQRERIQRRIEAKQRLIVEHNARFNELDVDADGYLSREELAPLLPRNVCGVHRDAALTGLVAMYDVDGDGRLSPKEALRLFHDVEKDGLMRCLEGGFGSSAAVAAASRSVIKRSTLEHILLLASSSAAMALLEATPLHADGKVSTSELSAIAAALSEEREAHLRGDRGLSHCSEHGLALHHEHSEAALQKWSRSALSRRTRHVETIMRIARSAASDDAAGECRLTVHAFATRLAATLPPPVLDGLDTAERTALVHALIADLGAQSVRTVRRAGAGAGGKSGSDNDGGVTGETADEEEIVDLAACEARLVRL